MLMLFVLYKTKRQNTISFDQETWYGEIPTPKEDLFRRQMPQKNYKTAEKFLEKSHGYR